MQKHTVKKIFTEVEGYPVIAGSLSIHIWILVQWKSIQIWLEKVNNIHLYMEKYIAIKGLISSQDYCYQLDISPAISGLCTFYIGFNIWIQYWVQYWCYILFSILGSIFDSILGFYIGLNIAFNIGLNIGFNIWLTSGFNIGFNIGFQY